MTEGKISVLIADDHAVLREGTRRILEDEGDFRVVGEVEDGLEAVRLAGELKPDVVLLDMAMPRANGVEATRQIKAVSPSSAILVLSAYDADQYVFAALEAGAAGYLLKTVSGRELVEAIRTVRRGESVLGPTVTRKVLLRLAQRAPAAPGTKGEFLTAREHEVLREAVRGASNKAIGVALGLSERTVQSHMASIFRKLNVASRTEAVTKAISEGLISVRDLP